MLLAVLTKRWAHLPPRAGRCARRLTTAARQHDEPLRILFCGSDDFSIASLKALHKYSNEANSNILSIDVATKKDKLTGRGLKKVKAPLIKSVAEELSLPLHQFDTFTGWAPPQFHSSEVPSINLVIAVSFGLLIPPRILSGATFGGLNVHPSLLPDLRGAAPLNWAIIRGYTHTGVSLQTLHPTRFDEGTVLAQTEAIKIPEDVRIDELRHMVSPISADLLITAIRKKLYLRPHASVARITDTRMSKAPKVLPNDRVLDPTADDLQTIIRKNRSVPKLFAYAEGKTSDGNSENLRIIFGTDIREADSGKVSNDVASRMQDGTPFALTKAGREPSTEPGPIYIVCKDQKVLEVQRLLVEGRKECAASQAAAGRGLFQAPFTIGDCVVFPFRGLFTKATG